MWTIHIDTTNVTELKLSLTNGKEVIERRVFSEDHRSQGVLLLLDDILRSNHLHLSDISSISVATGPGSFTGIKVGVTIATMLSFLMSVPINGDKPGTIPYVQYGENKWNL